MYYKKFLNNPSPGIISAMALEEAPPLNVIMAKTKATSSLLDFLALISAQSRVWLHFTLDD